MLSCSPCRRSRRVGDGSEAAVSMSLSKPAVPRPKSRPLPSAVTGSSAHAMREAVADGPRSMPEARPLHARKGGYDVHSLPLDSSCTPHFNFLTDRRLARVRGLYYHACSTPGSNASNAPTHAYLYCISTHAQRRRSLQQVLRRIKTASRNQRLAAEVPSRI